MTTPSQVQGQAQTRTRTRTQAQTQTQAQNNKPETRFDDDYLDIPLANNYFDQQPYDDDYSSQIYPDPYSYESNYPFFAYEGSPRMPVENNSYKPYQNTNLSYTVSAPYTGYTNRHHADPTFSQTTTGSHRTMSSSSSSSSSSRPSATHTTHTTHTNTTTGSHLRPYSPSHFYPRVHPVTTGGGGGGSGGGGGGQLHKAYSYGGNDIYADYGSPIGEGGRGGMPNHKNTMIHHDEMFAFEDPYRSLDATAAFDKKEFPTHPSKASRHGSRLDTSRSLPGGFGNNAAHYKIRGEMDALSDDDTFIKKVENNAMDTKAEKGYGHKRQQNILSRKEDEAIKKEMQERKLEEENLQKNLSQLQERLKQMKTMQEYYNKELEELISKWKEERMQIATLYNETNFPLEFRNQDDLDKKIEMLQKQNTTWDASLEFVSDGLKKELENLTEQINIEKKIGNQTKEYNEEIRRRIVELKIEKKQLEEDLKIMEEKGIDNQSQTNTSDQEKTVVKSSEYPPESTVIQNLLQAQVEFYFSDYNLKRDKRLLQSVIKEHKGFLPLDEVLNLARIRQLCSDKEQLIAALKRSKVLVLKDDMVGRERFEKPREKEFPFRRTVFIFGIPPDADEQFLQRMLSPFGTITKVQFDNGPESLDRITGRKFLAKPRVYQLYAPDTKIPMEFVTKGTHEKVTSSVCHSCNKLKPLADGFYVSESWKVIYCAQCAARVAEQQLNTWYNHKADRTMFLGAEPTDLHLRKTALVVFASQRQASKCAYVRTRIAHEGAFATHFHHFSKVRKEAAQSADGDKTKLTSSTSIPEDIRDQSSEARMSLEDEEIPSTYNAPKSYRSQQKSTSGGASHGQSNAHRQRPAPSQQSSRNISRKKNTSSTETGTLFSQRSHPVRPTYRYQPAKVSTQHSKAPGPF